MTYFSQVDGGAGALSHQVGLLQMMPAAAQTPANNPNVDTSLGYPRGVNTGFADSVAGTQPQPERDLHFALMSNDSYHLPGTNGLTGTASEAELQAAGWNRLVPDGDRLVDAQGNEIPIHPSMLSDAETGFDAAIYQNDQGNYVIAFRGTDNWGVGQGGDSIANGGQGLGMETAQYSSALALAEQAVQVFGSDNLAITGHSLGGGLASAAMVATGTPGVTFNASGLSDNTLRQFDLNPNAAREHLAESGQIRRYVVDGDPLTLAQQDVPAIPLPIAGLVSPPSAVGHELRIDPPAGTSGLIDLHGGGGEATSYVEALRQNTAYAPVDPLAGTDAGLVRDTLTNIGELNLNQIGALVRNGIDLGQGVASTVQQTASDIGDVISNDFGNGRVISGTTGIVGDVVDGVLDIGGETVAAATDFVGDTVQNVGTFGGGVLRDVGDRVGFDAPFDFAASILERGGELGNWAIDGIGNGVSWGLDTIGDGVEWALDGIGNGLQWGAERAIDGAVWAGEKIIDGAVWTGGKIVEGVNATVDAAVWAGGKVVDGATWAGEKVVEGGQAVVDGAKWAGGKVVDGARWLGDKLNPFN